MKMSAFLFGSLLALLVAGVAPADDPGKTFHPPPGTVNQIVEALKRQMPNGWSVNYDKDNAWIEIDRDQKIMAYSTVENQSADQKAERIKFNFALRVVPFMSKETHQKLQDENEQISRDLDQMRREFGIEEMWGGDWGVVGRTANENDRKHIAIFEQTQRKWHELPGFYFSDVSLEWAPRDPDRFGLYPYAPADDKVLRECNGVIKRIEAALNSY